MGMIIKENKTSIIVMKIAIIIGLFLANEVFFNIYPLSFIRRMTVKDYGVSRYGIEACFANQRVLLGSIEMYNLDHEKENEKISDTTNQNDYKKMEKKLIDGRYLKCSIDLSRMPNCVYYNYDATKGLCSCPYHGSVDGSISPSKQYLADERRREFNETYIPIIVHIVVAFGILLI